MQIEELKKENKELKILAKELLAGANRCSEAPYYMVQPFFGIVKRHIELISRCKLFEDKEVVLNDKAED